MLTSVEHEKLSYQGRAQFETYPPKNYKAVDVID